MLVSKVFSVKTRNKKKNKASDILEKSKYKWRSALIKVTAGYLARNTACLISCSAFLNSLFTTQACSRDTHSHCSLSMLCCSHVHTVCTRATTTSRETVSSNKKLKKTTMVNEKLILTKVNLERNSAFIFNLYCSVWQSWDNKLVPVGGSRVDVPNIPEKLKISLKLHLVNSSKNKNYLNWLLN